MLLQFPAGGPTAARSVSAESAPEPVRAALKAYAEQFERLSRAEAAAVPADKARVARALDASTGPLRPYVYKSLPSAAGYLSATVDGVRTAGRRRDAAGARAAAEAGAPGKVARIAAQIDRSRRMLAEFKTE